MSYNLIRPQLLTNDWSEANANHLTVCVLLRTRSTVPYHTVSSPTHTHTDRLVLWWLVSCSRVQRTTHGAESHIDRHVQCAHIRHKTWASRSCHRAGAQKRATFELAFVIRERVRTRNIGLPVWRLYIRLCSILICSAIIDCRLLTSYLLENYLHQFVTIMPAPLASCWRHVSEYSLFPLSWSS